MTSITKKQTSIAVFAIAFATLMIAGGIFSAASDNSAFAQRHHHHHHHHHSSSSDSGTHQSISQGCNQHQSANVVSAGANSPIAASGNNGAVCTNTNNGGNAAVTSR
jgi:hypothetical protein